MTPLYDSRIIFCHKRNFNKNTEVIVRLAERPVILIAAIAILIMIFSVLLYGNIVVSLFARCNDLDISYKRLNTISINEFLFKDLKAVERKHGMGFSSADARIKLVFSKSSPLNPTADLKLSDVRLMKRGREREASYSNIDGLVSAPFSGLLKYNTVSGKIASVKDGIIVRDFLASGDDIKFSFDGILTEESNINADKSIYFAKSLLGKIPPEITNMVLKESDGQWKCFSVKLEGDLAKPAIRVTGKMFRLNIGVK